MPRQVRGNGGHRTTSVVPPPRHSSPYVTGQGIVPVHYRTMNSGPTLYGEFCGMRAEPFGSGSLANEFDFAGQQTDPTGLQYLRVRY